MLFGCGPSPVAPTPAWPAEETFSPIKPKPSTHGFGYRIPGEKPEPPPPQAVPLESALDNLEQQLRTRQDLLKR